MESSSKPLMKQLFAVEKNKVELREVPIPVPASGQVLIKVEAAPIHPIDQFMIRGEAPGLKYPAPLGFEGSGTVVENGGGLFGWLLKGKKVAFSSVTMGAWAEYVVVDSMTSCLEIDQDVSYDQLACAICNPFSAIAILDVIQSGKFPAMVQTAANSAIAKMIIRLCKEEGIKTINIIRNEDQRQGLIDIGATVVLNQNDQNFLKDFEKISHELDARIIFDTISGELPGKLLTLMPKNSEIHNYGFLTKDTAIKVDMADCMLNNKHVYSFNAGAWAMKQGMFTLMGAMKRIKKEVKTNLKTEISERFPIESFQDALEYYEKNPSKGKVLLKPRMLKK